mmetsp:Transcript_8958/g.37652  ORF Transcript_8958/g.37652 Transcript_8958/m.37652 type:complete len:206 (-) Transcript_8958:373-990(-)
MREGLVEAHERVHQVDPPGHVQVVSVPSEALVVRRLDAHPQVAGLAVDERFALLEEQQLVSVGDARIDIHAKRSALAREFHVRALLALFLGVLLEHPRSDLLGDHALLAVALALALRGHDHVLVASDAQNLPEVQVVNGHLQVHRNGVSLRGLRLPRFPTETPESAPEELAEDIVSAEPATAGASLLRVLLHALFAVPIVDAALL